MRLFHKAEKIHFVGIGGVGMSGIAELLLVLGFRVSGSDLAESAAVLKLRKKGAVVAVGHRRENVKTPDVVVISSAVAKNNPEILEAKKLGVPVIQRAEMLAELMRLKKGIAVAGTHGKTTTTSMLGNIFDAAGWDPTTIVGGKFLNIGGNARYGKGEWLVCEADESDGSFLRLAPIVSIITNIDNDHMDHYGTEAALLDAFTQFANNVPFYGFTAVCGDDARVRKVLPRLTKTYYTYGTGRMNDFRISEVRAESDGMGFSFSYRGRSLGRFRVRRFGMHNVLNAAACVLVCLKLDMPASAVRAGLEGFQGVGRRMELTGEEAGVRVYDDYAHHPTELAATIAAFRMMKAKRRIGIFQPHRYSRTKLLAKEFGPSFKGLDELIVTDIYPASEKPIPGVTSKLILDRISGVPKVTYQPEKNGIARKLAPRLVPGDLVVTFGAGDVYKIGPELLHELKKSR